MKKSNYNSTFDWLLDPASPGVRFLALRDLAGLSTADPELVAAQKAAHEQGPIVAILTNMQPKGYWSKPGPGYNPKYFSTVWSLIALAQLGASASLVPDIQKACNYLLDHALAPMGQFTTNGAPSGTVDCLQGNLCAAMLALGCSDARMDTAFNWMARTVTGEGIAAGTEKESPMRYYAYKCGPLFACGANGQLPCAWGAAKVMIAFGKLPPERRTPIIRKAIEKGADFLLGIDPSTAAYPTRNGTRPNRSWWKFGFPVFYVTDILQLVEALAALGFGNDPRLKNAIDMIQQKQDPQGRWPLEYDYTGKMWVDFGPKDEPNPWVTLRALRVLRQVAEE